MIRELELRLERVKGDLDRSVIDELESELEHRKAWIAPVHRIPVELLSMIFVEAIFIDWRLLFVIGAVCRFWRQSLLGTPQAWSFMLLGLMRDVSCIPSILSRSAPYPINISILSKADTYLVSLLETHVERVRCIITPPETFKITRQSFLHLTTLVLRSSSGAISTRNTRLLLDGRRFPQLRRLHCGFVFDSVQGLIWHKNNLPPIEELGLCTSRQHVATRVCQILAGQLRVLYLYFQQPYITSGDEPTEIEFPILTSLTIRYMRHRGQPQTQLFNGHTPMLYSYTQSAELLENNLHQDTGTVQRLTYLGVIDFRPLPRVRIVISEANDIVHLVDTLEKEPHVLPDLERVVCERISGIRARLTAFNQSYGRNIRVLREKPTVGLAAPLYTKWNPNAF